ncbi:MAG: alpha/beta hydrolase [Cellulomonadaceae bacterium]|jgi:hypothetical protein|nr:alpha/beta hydrolase [Cellulomonadaceae bacterium]
MPERNVGGWLARLSPFLDACSIFIALLVVLAVFGSVAGPVWDPPPVLEQIVPETSSTAIGGLAAGIAAGRAFEPGTFAVSEEITDIPLEGASTAALLRLPIGADFPVPALLFVHGAGSGLFTDAFVDQASVLASMGIATLVPNKRSDNYSTFHRDYEAMALDYLGSFQFLQSLAAVDVTRVGVYSESEGTWIAPIMSTLAPDIAFNVFVSPPVVLPRLQVAFAADQYLRETRVPWQVFRAIPRALGMSFPGTILAYADFDVSPWLAQLDQPILVVYGTADISMPLVQGAQEIIEIASRAAVTVRYYEGANHGIRVSGQVVPEFIRDVGNWVQGLPETGNASPQIAGGQPVQMFLAAPFGETRWWGDGNIVIGSVLFAVLLFLAAALLWFRYRKLLRPRTSFRPRKPFGNNVWRAILWLAISVVISLGALVAYLISVGQLAFRYLNNDLLVQGGWIVVRLLGAGAVACLAWLITQVRRFGGLPTSATEPGRPVSKLAAVAAPLTFWLVVGGATILLLWLAYWGIFQIGI